MNAERGEDALHCQMAPLASYRARLTQPAAYEDLKRL
jgi:hypothetical protein